MSPGGYRESFEPEPRSDLGLWFALAAIAVIWGGFLYLAWEWMTR